MVCKSLSKQLSCNLLFQANKPMKNLYSNSININIIYWNFTVKFVVKHCAWEVFKAHKYTNNGYQFLIIFQGC